MGGSGENVRGGEGEGGFFSCKFHLASSTPAQPHRHIEVMWWDLDLYSGGGLVEGPKRF